MESPAGQRKKMTKQLTGKRDDTTVHSLVRTGQLNVVSKILSSAGEEELLEMLSKQNQSGETPLYVAAEYGHVDIVREMIQYHDPTTASIKARNGYDAFHIAAKQGDLGMALILEILQYSVFSPFIGYE